MKKSDLIYPSLLFSPKPLFGHLNINPGVNYLKTPPFLILHGSEDPAVPPDQSRLLRNALEEAGIPVHMYLVPGGVHALGGKLVYDVVQEFLDYYVKGIKTVETPPIEGTHERRDPPA